ncbi:MAG TPA: hypothetical protein VLG50_07830 [Candidatus Saccharimonadales bacterium]|nr:hypothetical protein [Candidatus Saccharimonadales bacterium]
MSSTDPIIYRHDFDIINHSKHYMMMYHDDDDIYSYVTANHGSVLYHMKQKDDKIILNTYLKSKKPDINNHQIDDIDLMNIFSIYKSRGIDYHQSTYMTNQYLLKLFTSYFNPHSIKDVLYLYTYLHANAILINLESPLVIHEEYTLTALLPQSLYDTIYQLYNALYVYINLLS